MNFFRYNIVVAAYPVFVYVVSRARRHYTMGTGSFPRIKWPDRCVDQTPASSSEVKGGAELYIYFPSGPSVACSSWNLRLPLGT